MPFENLLLYSLSSVTLVSHNYPLPPGGMSTDPFVNTFPNRKENFSLAVVFFFMREELE